MIKKTLALSVFFSFLFVINSSPVSAQSTEEELSSQTTTSAESVQPPPVEPAANPAPPSEPAPTASPQEVQARAAFQRGDQLYLEGDYLGAVQAFEDAYALSGRIEMLFNLANAHERLGNYSEASVALRGYIPHSPDSQRQALEKRLTRFEAMAQEKEAAALKAKAEAKIFPIDRAIGIGLLTLGSAGLVTGTAFAISAANTRSGLDEICEEGENGQLCPAEAESLLSRDRTYSLVADVSFVAGAAMAAAGLFLVIRSGDKEGGEVQASAAPGTILLRGSF